MRYGRAIGKPARGEYSWACATASDAATVSTAPGVAGAEVVLRVHLVHEDRVLEAIMEVIGSADEAIMEVIGSAETVDGFSALEPAERAEAMYAAGDESGYAPDLELDLGAHDLGDLGDRRVSSLGGGRAYDAGSADELQLVVRSVRFVGTQGGGPKEEGVAATETLSLLESLAAEEAEGGSPANPLPSEGAGHVVLYPASHYTIGQAEKDRVLRGIEEELAITVRRLLDEGQATEAERLRHRVASDLVDISRDGFCSGMENYARHRT